MSLNALILEAIVPTPVGVNRRRRPARRWRCHCPHARGGEPIVTLPDAALPELSPRPWG